VYFNDFGNSGFSRVAHVAASGGEVVPLSLPFPHQPLLVDVSPDGADLLVVVFDTVWFEPGELWVVPAVGGTPRRLGDLRANYAVWSPDGGRPRPVLPDWDRSACCGRWTADGSLFVFEAGAGRADLWVLPERGRLSAFLPAPEPVQLTEGAMQFLAPLPARDGRGLFAVGWKPQGELVRHDPASGHFVPYLGGMSAHEVDFSRDGQWFVYTTYPEATLWRSRVDGRDRRQLTVPPLVASLPRLSPDGAQVVFAALGQGQHPHLRLVPATGGSSRALTPPTDRNQLEGSWSPDSRRLAVGYSTEQRADRPITIDLFDLDTGRLSTVPGSEGLFSPRWSPDGRFLAALSADTSRLLLHDFDLGRWRVLLSAAGPNGHVAWPNWSADGRHLVLFADQTFTRLWVADGRRETIGARANLQLASYIFGNWIGVTPEGSPLALRNVSVNEIFALRWAVP